MTELYVRDPDGYVICIRSADESMEIQMSADGHSATGVGTARTSAALVFVHARRNDRHQDSTGCATSPGFSNARRACFSRVRMQPASQEIET